MTVEFRLEGIANRGEGLEVNPIDQVLAAVRAFVRLENLDGGLRIQRLNVRARQNRLARPQVEVDLQEQDLFQNVDVDDGAVLLEVDAVDDVFSHGGLL